MRIKNWRVQYSHVIGLNTRTTKVPASKAKIVFWTNLYCINLDFVRVLDFITKLNGNIFDYSMKIFPPAYLGVQNSSSIPSKQSFRQSQISNWGTQRPLSQETPLGQASCFARASSCNKTQKNRLVFEILSCIHWFSKVHIIHPP